MTCLKAPWALGMIAFMQLVSVNAQTNWAREFKVKDGVIYADGKPFPLIMDFTWSAPPTEAFFHYWSQMGGTAHYQIRAAIHPSDQQDFKELDQELEKGAKYGVYSVINPSVAKFGGSYLSNHPDALMRGPGEAKLSRDYPSFVHEGYRQALVKALQELALHVKDKPYILGYYLQDEFSYPGWGGYEPISAAFFQSRMLQQYGSIERLNAAWGTKYARQEDIAPPEKAEPGRRFADWQLYRRWAYGDIVRLCCQTIKAIDPGHLVIHSVDFWGNDHVASAWWDMPQSADVLMRHGIGYDNGYNLFLIREIAEWGGKPGAALCMPPGSCPSFNHFMYLLDAGRVGLSYVCIGGTASQMYYQGPADSAEAYRRRERQYTPAKALIQLEHYLGATYLESKRLPPQVGYLLGDRTASITGVNLNAVAGMLKLLTDLNVDFAILSEHNHAPLSRFKALIVGPAMNLVSDVLVKDLEDYVRDGRSVILMPGACGRNEWNEEMNAARFSGMKRYGRPVTCDRLVVGGQELAVAGKRINPIEVRSGDKIQGWVKGQTNVAAVVLADGGKTLLFGWDIGSLYQSGWTAAYAGVEIESESDRQERLAQAFGVDNAKEFSSAATNSLQPQRVMAGLVQDYLKTAGVEPSVQVRGYEAPAIVRAQAFAHGDSFWVGLANRMARPGQTIACSSWDIEKGEGGVWPRDYHVPITGAQVSVRLPGGLSNNLRGFRMPNMRVEGSRLRAVPEELSVKVERKGDTSHARFNLGKVDDWAAVVLAPAYKLLVGLELDRREAGRGDTVKATMSVLNGTGNERKGKLILKVEEELQIRPEGCAYQIKPGETNIVELAVKVPADARSGYYSLRALATDEDGTVTPSMDLELRVMDAGVVTMKPAPAMLYARIGESARLEVNVALRNNEYRGKIRAVAEGFNTFIPEPQEQEWELGKDQEHTFAFSFKAPAEPDASEKGAITIEEHIAGIREARHTRPCRVSSGCATYIERRSALPRNNSTEPAETDFICLENERMIIRIDPARAVIHNMILRQSGVELLSPDDYPYGLVWYSWKNVWQLKKAESNRVELASTSPAGKPVVMITSLKDNYMDVTYDAVQCEPGPHSFYLMSRISGKSCYDQNAIMAPIKGKVEELKWKRGVWQFKAQDLSCDWVAVADKVSRHILVTFFDIPSLNDLYLAPGRAACNYEVFHLKRDVIPGPIRFRLAGGTGDVERVNEWKTYWEQRK